MELFDHLGPAVAAELSSMRSAVPRQLLLGPDADQTFARELRAECAASSPRAVLLFDARTRTAAGERCAAALRDAGFSVHELLVADGPHGDPVCDDVTVRELAGRLPEADVIAGAGAGVISDLAKWLAFEVKRPAAIFATAASMNGYAAANVAPAVAGVKTLVHARAHRIVASDPAVLAAAPAALTSAGLGDVIAKWVSTADWKMNDMLFGEDYRPAIAGIIDQVEQKFLRDPKRLATFDRAAVAGLFEALVYSGCAMTLQGSSLPASGGEHLISHTLDMRAMAERGTHDLHGRQVGLGTIFAAALYERVLSLPAPRFAAAPLPLDRATWGASADAVAAHHAKQTVRMAQACERLAQGDTWSRVRAALAPMLKSARHVKDVLVQANAAHRIADIGIDRERFLWAVLNCAQIRERFTSIDLAWVTGVLPHAAEEIIDEYLVR